VSVRSLFILVLFAFLSYSCSSAVSNDIPQESDETLASSEEGTIVTDKRFTKNVLVDNLNEPTEFEVLEDGKVLFTQRRGDLMLFDPGDDKLTKIAQFDVNTKFEDGLMGLALDPNYEENNWIYLFYSPASKDPNASNEDYVPTKEESKQHLSRFDFKDGVLDMDSEILMLEVQTQRIECCHTGGSIEFGPDGNLFLSTGDDVNPFASDGFGPIDEQPGRSPWDGQTTSANTNDLRGKILRITPQPDGTYTIPEGNLFPVGTEKTRPEIYVMGNRNPYRISIDQKTGYLYWGEVGPDANENNPDRGPRGHDEVNQARQAGNFGWPLFVGDNKAYNDYNFATQTSGAPFDPMAPINDSPNNTGLQELPPAQKAFIWYPYAESPEFPMLGSGGRNAMAGPVFYKDAYEVGSHSFPAEYDGKLFIYDWMRGWIMTVTMDENSDLERIEPFMPGVEFSNPIDMLFDKEGVMYVMEYGKGWFSQNQDARISRIEYNADRAMIADAGNNTEAMSGSSSAELEIALEGNQTFFFGNESRSYDVKVVDGEINPEQIQVSLDYLPMGHDKTLIAQGHQMADESASRITRGEEVIGNSDCSGCHQMDRQSIGPTYKQIAGKYADDPEAKPYLMDKIKNGGGGVWGEQPMAAHPQLTDDELGAMVDYIMSVNDSDHAGMANLGAAGTLSFDEHMKAEAEEGTYYLRAAAKSDENANSDRVETTLVLRHPRVQAEYFEDSHQVGEEEDGSVLYRGSYIGLKDVDLTGISSLTYFVKRADRESIGGRVEARLGSPDGTLIGQVTVDDLADKGRELNMAIQASQGMHDVYLVAKNDASTETNLFFLDWVLFNK